MINPTDKMMRLGRSDFCAQSGPQSASWACGLARAISDRLRIGVAILLLGLLAACRSSPYRPPELHPVQDRWQVTVGRDGQVQITRHIFLDTRISAYLRGATNLDQARLFGPIQDQERNECRSQVYDQSITLDCTITYRILAMPSQRQATLVLPDDYLVDFLLEGLAYQPLALDIKREIEITVPGTIQKPGDKQETVFPVYASQTTESRVSDSSHMQIETVWLLAPGDRGQPAMQHLPPIEFKPAPGLP